MPLPKEEYYTLALTWDEQEQIELIHRMPVLMAPPSRVHQEISGEIYRQIANYLEGKKCKVYPAPFTVRLFEKIGDKRKDVNTMVEPGLSITGRPRAGVVLFWDSSRSYFGAVSRMTKWGETRFFLTDHMKKNSEI